MKPHPKRSFLSCHFVIYLVRTIQALVFVGVDSQTANLARDRAGPMQRPRAIHSLFSVARSNTQRGHFGVSSVGSRATGDTALANRSSQQDRSCNFKIHHARPKD
jgi:hypothetical protein